MKQFYLLTVFCLFFGGIFYANAQDVINLKDGKTIQAKVLEITPTEIKYKRFDNQNGPTITIYAATVVSIKYQNGVVDEINAAPMGAATGTGQQTAEGYLSAQLQNLLNSMPAVTIAGNSLKFQFNGDKWTALLNGENFSTGVTEVENTATGSILTLKQTHIWPGAAVKTAGKAASRIPGASAVGGAVNTASSAAGAAGLAPGAVESSGKAIVLEYVANPPKLSYLKSVSTPGGSGAGDVITLGNVGFKIEKNTASEIQFNISTENLEGEEKDVLNINGALSKSNPSWAEVFTGVNEEIKQRLINGSGIRFKVIGDGKLWNLMIPTTDTEEDNGHFMGTIQTKKNKIVKIDIPYSKLKQPFWGKKKKFNKNNILRLHFAMGDALNNKASGNYSIKIFDIEVY